MSATPTPGALRAAQLLNDLELSICEDPKRLVDHAQITNLNRAALCIDRETKLPEFRYVLRQIMSDLPMDRRDWLDPQVERMAHELLKSP